MTWGSSCSSERQASRPKQRRAADRGRSFPTDSSLHLVSLCKRIQMVAPKYRLSGRRRDVVEIDTLLTTNERWRCRHAAAAVALEWQAVAAAKFNSPAVKFQLTVRQLSVGLSIQGLEFHNGPTEKYMETSNANQSPRPRVRATRPGLPAAVAVHCRAKSRTREHRSVA